MQEYLIHAIVVFGSLIFAKAILIGSDFSFWYWFKHKKKYWTWYKQRETFTEYLRRS